MRIIPISLPTPFYIGPVNAAGFLVSDIQRIVLTHAHEDHCGLARSLRDEAKHAEVLVHGWETGHRIGRLEYEEHRSLLVRAGVPDDEIDGMRRMYEGVRKYADSFADHEYSPLWDEGELEFATGSWRIVHTPGHTIQSIPQNVFPRSLSTW